MMELTFRKKLLYSSVSALGTVINLGVIWVLAWLGLPLPYAIAAIILYELHFSRGLHSAEMSQSDE